MWFLKGSDQLCKVVELSMQCCGKLLSDSDIENGNENGSGK